jgi:cathepsin B
MKLSSALKTKISNNPTFTRLRNYNEQTESEYKSLPVNIIDKPNLVIPDSFDGVEIWGELLTPVRNQGKCGSCWAFASTSVLADRFNIQSIGQYKLNYLSPTKLILCDFLGHELDTKHPELETNINNNINSLNTGACGGNTLYDAWRYLYLFGTNTEECVPYESSIGSDFGFNSLSKFSKSSRLPLCIDINGPLGDMCSDVTQDLDSGIEFGTPAKSYRCIRFYTVAGVQKDNGSEWNIRYNIYNWGPVTTGMTVYPDFYEFDAKNDIYEWNGQGQPVGGHAIEIVGWGEKNGKKYWIIENTWGKEYGRDGYFWMARGTNTCGIEENVIAGMPDFFYPIGYRSDSRCLPCVGHTYTPSPFKWGASASIEQQRLDLSTDLNEPAGGIDVMTGYTRRVMETKPWLHFHREVSLENLPDWKTFVAGIDAAPKARAKYQRMIRARHPVNKYNSFPLYITFSILFTLTILSILHIKMKK